jgi:hypothetical protein
MHEIMGGKNYFVCKVTSFVFVKGVAGMKTFKELPSVVVGSSRCMK